MKVRIGYGLGVRTPTLDGGRFAELVDALEALRFDSLWLSGASPEPVPSPWSASRSPPLAPASSSWAPRCRCCPGATSISWPRPGPRSTASPAAGACPRSASASPIPASRRPSAWRGDRARRFDEALPKLRALWAGEEVDGAAIAPLPVQSPLDVWLGGIAPSELRRVGRHGDGWLPSFCTPADVAEGRPVVEGEAAAHGRTIDPEHWGALIPYLADPVPLPDLLVDAVRARRPRSTGGDRARRARRRASDRHGLRGGRGVEVRAGARGRARRLAGASRRGGRRHRRPRELTGRPSRRT